MKVITNSIGNYSPQVKQSPVVESRIKTGSANSPVNFTKEISEEEKKFFSGLYPENKNDISNYHFYHKSGELDGVKIGSQFDRKG